MIVNHLYSQILNGKWLIDPLYADSQGPIIANLLNHSFSFEASEPDPMSAYAVMGNTVSGVRHSYRSGFDKATEGSVAVIGVQDTLFKHDQECGPIGMATMGRIVQAADEHPNIDAIVLHIDSPGGTVDGTEALGTIIKATNKPVVAFVDGLMASAALWIGSAADERIASTDTDQIGSCGVKVSFMDMQPYWEKLGIKFHNIAASTSPDKMKVEENLRKGDYSEFIANDLDVLDAKFMDTLRANLPNVKDEHLTGNMFFARDVMGVYIDAIGTLDDAILRAKALSEEQTPPPTKTNSLSTSSTSNIMKQHANVNAALGVPSLESVDEQVSLNAEQLEALDTAIATGNTAQNDLTAATQARTTAETNLATANATIAAQATELIELRGAAAGKPPVAKTKTDDETKPATPGSVAKGEDLGADMEAVAKEYF